MAADNTNLETAEEAEESANLLSPYAAESLLCSQERTADALKIITWQLERISQQQSAAADALENIAAALNRAYPERIRPAQQPQELHTTAAANVTNAATGEEMTDADLLNLISKKRNTK